MTAALIPATCELWIDGARYPDGATGQDPAEPVALSGLTVHWGRSTSIDQPAPASCTFTLLDRPGGTGRFDATVSLGSAVLVWAALDGRRVLVFGGRVTDLSAAYDGGAGGAACDVIATDQLADLASRYVGAEPWPNESLSVRARRILDAARPGLQLVVAARPGALSVSRLDVDRQAADGLLTELAVTGGAVLWTYYAPATGAPVIFYEDPTTRASLYVFAQQPTLLWAPQAGTGGGAPLSACVVLRDPVQWSRAVTDLITRATVRWLDQSTTPGTTERSAALVDTAAEATYGARGISVSTLLTSATDAQNLAAGLLATHPPTPAWRTTGLTWDLADAGDETDPALRTLALTLLDGAARLGYAVALTDLPDWTPTAAAVQLYVEGGTYGFDEGRWVLALNAGPATGLGASLTYGQTDPSVRYVDIDRSVSFLEMMGVGPATYAGRGTWAAATGTWAAATGNWMEQP